MTSFTGRLTIPEQPSIETTKQPAPLGGRYGTGWSLPPDNAPADVMATARLAGHEWDDIENYYGEVYDKAQQVGHSAEAVDKHFGYPDRKPFDDQTEQQIKRQLQVAPDLRSVLDAPDPAKAINDNAGLMIRDAYADALMAGQVKTPGDFTAKFFGHYLQAVHAGDDGRVPMEEKEKSQAVAQALAATLPTQRDAVDYAIALAGQGDLPFTPALVNVVKGNLMDEYAATGQSLTDIFNRAQKDPELNARLTQPVSDQPDWSISTALGRIWEEAKKGAKDAYEAPLANGRDFWGIKPDDNTPTNNARILGYVASKDLDAIVRSPIALTLAGARAGAQILKEAGISEADADDAMRFGLAAAMAWGAKGPGLGVARFKVPTFDPVKPVATVAGDFPERPVALPGAAAALSRLEPLARGDFLKNGEYVQRAMAQMAEDIMPAGERVRNPIVAYHGSPHEFDVFSSEHIGAGEGAQAFGYGLYFSENPNVAESYRVKLSHPQGGYGPIPPEILSALKSLDNLGFDTPGEALGAARSHPDWRSRWPGDASEASAYDAIQRYVDETKLGSSFRVNLHLDPELLLDWDKKVSEQPAPVQAALAKLGIIGDATDGGEFMGQKVELVARSGQDVAKTLEERLGKKQAADALRDAGIQGIRYFDGGSRSAGDGTRNYVVFHDAKIEMVEKNGKPIEAAAVQAQIEGLAEGYNVSNAVLSMFHNLMIDQSGALNLSLNLFRTTEQIMERANKIEANEYAKARVREFRGMADQIVAGLSHQLEKYRRDINQHLPDYAKWLRQGAARDANNKPLIQNLIDYMEGRSTGALLDPHSPFAPVADALRGVNEFMRAQIEAHDPNLINFYQDYFRHLWVNPRAADVAFGVGRQGTSRSLLARTVPTISEGIEKGLMPKILDPIDNTLHYVSGMANYLAARKVIDISKDAGYIKYGGEAPHPGWEKLNGMSSVVAAGDNAVQYAWAQQGYARAYNAWVGKGFHEWAVGGTIYDKLQYAANAMTGMKLALSQYHLFNIAKETGIAGLTNGLGEIARGDIIQGMLHMASGATILPELVRQRNAGKRFQEMYLDLGNQSELVDLFAAAGGRAVGRAAQYRINQASNIQTALRRGSLFQELGNDIRSMFREQGGDENIPYRIARFPDRTAGVFMHEIGRVLDSLNGPLFDGLIPKVKNAAWADEMEAWLRHNMQASREEKLAMSRKILDSMDMRFGEMNQDNLFWNRMLKQTLNLFTVSVGWEYGTFAAFGTGARDIMKGSFNTTNARWMIGFPAMIAITSSVYMYMKTGGFPQSIRDVLVPPTDGTLADLQTPERNLMPGYEKDVLQWYKIFQLAPDFTGSFQNSLKYMGNKLNPFWQAWITLGTGQDKIGHYVLNEPHPPFESWGLPPRWGNTLRTIVKEMTPILADQKEMRGSNISRLERYFGFRPASLFDTDPAQAQARMEKEERRRDKVERRRDAREKAKEAPAPWLPGGNQ